MERYQVRLTRDAYVPGRATHRMVEVEIDPTSSLHYGSAEPSIRKMWKEDCAAMACAKGARLREQHETVTGWIAPSDDVTVPASELSVLNERIAELEAEVAARKRLSELQESLRTAQEG